MPDARHCRGCQQPVIDNITTAQTTPKSYRRSKSLVQTAIPYLCTNSLTFVYESRDDADLFELQRVVIVSLHHMAMISVCPSNERISRQMMCQLINKRSRKPPKSTKLKCVPRSDDEFTLRAKNIRRDVKRGFPIIALVFLNTPEVHETSVYTSSWENPANPFRLIKFHRGCA